EIFVRRGIALGTRIYPDRNLRRRLYKTSLPPRSASRFLEQHSTIVNSLAEGGDYGLWRAERRLAYVRGLVEQIGRIAQFRVEERVGQSATTWEDVLAWWLDRNNAARRPDAREISRWHAFASKNFGYRFNRGLGAIVAVVLDELHGGELIAARLREWPSTG